jgi:hypothetical protein
MISSCTNTQLLNSRLSNATQVQTLTGKYPLPNGLQFLIGLTRANRLEKLQGIISFPMRLCGALFVLFASRG